MAACASEAASFASVVGAVGVVGVVADSLDGKAEEVVEGGRDRSEEGRSERGVSLVKRPRRWVACLEGRPRFRGPA